MLKLKKNKEESAEFTKMRRTILCGDELAHGKQFRQVLIDSMTFPIIFP